MNWIKSAPPAESFNEITSRALISAIKWTKGQRTFISLPFNDQMQLIAENIAELFVLQMAETKSSFNEGCELILKEKN